MMKPASETGDILKETMEAIQSSLGYEMETITVEKTVIGLFFHWSQTGHR